MSDDKFTFELNTDAFKRATEQLKLTAEQAAELSESLKNIAEKEAAATVTASLLVEAWNQKSYGALYPMSIVPTSEETRLLDTRSIVFVLLGDSTPIRTRIPLPYKFATKPIDDTVGAIEKAAIDWSMSFVNVIAIEVPESLGKGLYLTTAVD